MCLKGYICLAAFLLLSSSTGAGAAMFKCKSANGSVQYTNAPTLSSCVEIKPKGISSGFSRSYSSRGDRDPSRYDSHIQSASFLYNIDPLLIRAIIRVESDFDRYAVSKTGAKGLMQLMPETARELNVSNSFDPAQNIHGGTRYLRKLLDMFKGDLVLAIAAYNAGPTVVKKINRIPAIRETRDYVNKVLVHYKKYRQQSGDTKGNTIQVGGLEVARAE